MFCLTVQPTQLHAVGRQAVCALKDTQTQHRSEIPRRTPAGLMDGILLEQNVCEQENVKLQAATLFPTKYKSGGSYSDHQNQVFQVNRHAAVRAAASPPCPAYFLGTVSIGRPHGHLLKLLLAQASKTLYFSVASPLKASLVYSVIQFFIDCLKGVNWVAWWETGTGCTQMNPLLLALTWALVWTLLVSLALRLLVMLRGSSPNLI